MLDLFFVQYPCRIPSGSRGLQLAHGKQRPAFCSLVMSNDNNNKADDNIIHSPTHCGFATLLGPSNSGKSTLVNHLVGSKVAIVTPKVQTTRCRIAGIATYDKTQVVFLDTPGIFSAKNRLSRAMVKSAWKSSRDGDVVAIVLDGLKLFKWFSRKAHHNISADKDGHEHEMDENEGKFDDQLNVPSDIQDVLNGVEQARRRGQASRLCVCTNKMDAIRPHLHENILQDVSRMLGQFNLASESIPIFPISARTGDNVDTFRNWVVNHMPSGPWLYEEDDMTDMPMRQIAAEVCREKAFMTLKQELPYEIAVDTTEFKELKDGSIRITQDILVERDSQKRIVTGRGGSVVKEIGSKARMDLMDIFGTKVHLMLTVKVRSKWKEEKWQYQQWGLDYNA